MADHYQTSMMHAYGQLKKLTCVERNYCLQVNKAVKLFTLSIVKGIKLFLLLQRNFFDWLVAVLEFALGMQSFHTCKQDPVA